MVAVEEKTVNKVCSEGELCPCQQWSLALSPHQRIKKRKRSFQKSKVGRQHEFSQTEKWPLKWNGVIVRGRREKRI